VTRHFCTYFDHRYLPRGLALRQSLIAHAPDHVLWVLALSDECVQWLRDANLPGVRVIPLPFLEAWDPELSATRSTRSLVEYYFTCSPCLPRYILSTSGDVDRITYLDSDLYFFSSPEPLFEEIGAAPIAIVPHRFSPEKAEKLEPYGRYNVGWLTFDRSETALACIDWWRASCITWCFDRLEPGRFADQKYLDEFERLFPATHVVRHPGANVAPWNIENCKPSKGPSVNGQSLIFYHFHGLKRLSDSAYDMHLREYGARADRVLREAVYIPYLTVMAAAERTVNRLSPSPPSASLRGNKHASWVRRGLERGLGRVRAILGDDVIRTNS
jgi:hypothetical protein